MSLGLVTCHFNPQNFQRCRRNYFRFREQLGHPILTVELSFSGRFCIDDAIQIRGDRTRHLMWQKERLLNIAIGALPDQIDKVAWLDADLTFLNPDWFAQTEALLDDYPVAQLAERVYPTDRQGKLLPDDALETFAWAHNHPEQARRSWYHTGYAWAARRDVLGNSGLWDRDILGGADAAQTFTWSGQKERWHKRFPRERRLAVQGIAHSFQEWADPQQRLVANRIGWVPGDVIHWWHGEKVHRRYVERNQILLDNYFDPTSDIRLSPHGLWEWASEKPRLHQQVRSYFANRREDG